MLSIDWLSINYRGIYNGSKVYTEKSLKVGSNVFKNIVELYHLGDLCFTILYNPASSAIRQDLIQIKVANKLLYHNGLLDIIQMLESDLCITFVGFSRVDLCFDFNTFNNKYDPKEFILHVASNKVIKKGKCKYDFRAINESFITYEYFRIGSSNSQISCYLYNKTKEMSDVKDKPYIREKWLLNDININLPVWRLEFTIKGDQWTMINMCTGEDIQHSISMILRADIQQLIFSHLYERIFKFYKNNRKLRKDRNQPLNLLTLPEGSFSLKNWSQFLDNTRSDKIFINKLLNTWDKLREMKKDEAINYYTLAEDTAKRHDLYEYFLRKLEFHKDIRDYETHI